METPLNAREFLKRFHLPQLVRINQQQLQIDDYHEENSPSNQSPLISAEDGGSPNSSAQSEANHLSPGHSNTSISSSFVAVASLNEPHQHKTHHKPSHWTYSGLNPFPPLNRKQIISSSRSHQDLQKESGSRSLLCDSITNNILESPSSTNLNNHDEDDDEDDEDDDNNQFRSISAWSSVQVNRMLEQQQLTVRVPRASLMAPSQQQQQQDLKPLAARKSVEFRSSVAGSGGFGAKQQKGASVLNNHKSTTTHESIRLTPPSKRPTLSKLELNQPFLLYKAYKKLELCAYIIDPKNELNEKSGDPIYFPQNYPGWFTITDPNQQEPLRQPLETIDQVCQSQAQVFLSRDELIGYQLPRKLSHLTKLKNNQLLALPLAINLDRNAAAGHSSSSGQHSIKQEQATGGGGSGSSSNSGGGSKSKENISDIKQVVIKAGQALKVCGIYEDVLPLIEGKQQQQHQQQKQQQQSKQKQTVVRRPASFAMEDNYQVAPPVMYQQQQQHFYQSLAAAENSLYQPKQKRTRRLLKLRSNNKQQADFRQPSSYLPPAASASGGHYEAPPPIYAVNGHQHLPKGSKLKGGGGIIRGQQQKQLQNNQKQQQQQQQQQVGQRYARCVLLSQSSVDKLTDCSSRSPQQLHQQLVGAEESDVAEEIEVLIPIDQRGRFYLCATNQSIMNELYCYLCLAASHTTNLVFKLSQIVYLLSLSRRLIQRDLALQQTGSQQELKHESFQQTRHRLNLGRAIRLPLSVRLISGPRPANFSPSMFGTSSTMESYFRSEDNVAGHSIQCPYNKGFILQQPSNDPKHHNNHHQQQQQPTAGGSICPCAQQLNSNMSDGLESYGSFSASLRIERVSKRDVLLACTIKKDPLVHLDLFSDDIQRVDELQQRNSNVLVHTTTAATLAASVSGRLQSSRLMALREPTQSNCLDRQEATNLKATSGKSSFSRLRACRSLISLNGRRNKKRPNIPSSMLTSTTNDTSGGKGLPGQLSHNLSNEAGGGNQTNGQRGIFSADGTNGATIVMVEFDCNENELQFVRTFVESSIPTSSIPDLVIKRMEFCHRNSATWERQLKLTYRSLSQDFDSCQRQMEQNRRRLLASSLIRLAPSENDTLCTEEPYKKPVNRISDLSNVGGGLLAAATLTNPTTENDSSSPSQTNSRNTSTTSESVHSTASSRSSSGVSSAGDRHRKLHHNHHHHHQSVISGSTGNGTSTSSGTATNSSLQSSSGASSVSLHAPGSSSRLLRLVQRILPLSKLGASQQQHSITATHHHKDNPNYQHRAIAHEIANHFRQQQNTDLASRKTPVELTKEYHRDLLTTTLEDDTHATMMNAQKIHRKLLTGSVRHLAAEERNLDDSEDERCDRMSKTSCSGSGDTSSGSGKGGTITAAKGDAANQMMIMMKECGQDEDSHLYESLERLSIGLKSSSPIKKQQLESSRPTSQIERQSRLGLGKSIEMLVGGVRLSSVRPATIFSGDKVEPPEVMKRRQTTTTTSDEEDDDSNDDWWSIGDKTQTTRTEEPIKLAANQWKANNKPLSNEQTYKSSWKGKRTSNRLRDLCTMEPISIEHDEFVSMVCDEPNFNDINSSSSRSSSSSSPPHNSKTVNSRQAEGAEEIERRVEENIYMNIGPNGQLLEEDELLSRRPVGRIERKLMKIRGRRSGTRSPCNGVGGGSSGLEPTGSWITTEQGGPNSLVAGEPLAKLRPVVPRDTPWGRLDWRGNGTIVNSADSLLTSMQNGREKELSRTKTLTELEVNTSSMPPTLARSSASSSSFSSTEITGEASSLSPISSSGSIQSLDELSHSMGGHHSMEGSNNNNNNNSSRAIPFKGRCAPAVGPGNQVTGVVQRPSRTGTRTSTNQQQQQRATLATLDRTEPAGQLQRH